MRQLRLVGVAEDGASLLLEAPTGEAFRLPLDERVRAACRGDLTRLGQIEIEMDNPLRPREIQARVRAGESAEEVAAASGMPLDRVLRFASPMLQERERVVAQARVTRPHPKRPETLAELVEERLVGRGTDAATLRWDAWRREDGKWTVRLSWRHTAEHSASWTFQLAARSLQPDDPAAEQLSAEEFHARTITPVTPLAAAARVSGQPGPPRPGGGQPAPGAERPGAGRQPGADRPARG
ncbi:MAG: septation protein SepH, partial [Mycobacteriales bacterium]